MQKWERKVKKNYARINEKKKQRERSEKLKTQALGELKCVYTKEKWLKIRMLLNKAVLEAFWISGLRELKFWAVKSEVKISSHLSCSRQMEGIVTSSIIWMYVTVKQKLLERRPFL